MGSSSVLWWLVALGGAAVLVWLGRRAWRRRVWHRLYNSPLPTFAVDILERRVALYSRLPADLKTVLHGHINCFLHHKAFVGCDGLEITDEMRLIVAANACLLVLKQPPPAFANFVTILVYPDAFVAEEVVYDGWVETREHSVRLGESWHRGPVVLSWPDVLAGSTDSEDGQNVVIHEFAHKLDEDNILMDGLPVLREPEHYAEWSRVLSRDFDAFRQRVADSDNNVIDSYGAESAAEFFAVISESFFEKPRQMREQWPELYQQLANFFQLDPARW